MGNALIGLATGVVTGLVMTRWGLCFNRGLRRAVFEHRPGVLRAFAIAVGAQLLLLPILVAVGVSPLAASTAAGGLPLLPVAQVAGGLLFGAGMALAGGCVTGILWKTGQGSMALAIAIAGFAVGELLIRGPGDGVITALDDAARPEARGLPDALGVGYAPLALILGAVALVALARGGRRGIVPGLALGAVAAGAWVTADAAGYSYGLGFVGAAEGTRSALAAGGALPYPLWLAVGVVLGGTLAGPRRLRLPGTARGARAAAGGLAMGVGGSVAHGCNIGQGLTGIPLLSLGSMLATVAMAAGALLTRRLMAV